MLMSFQLVIKITNVIILIIPALSACSNIAIGMPTFFDLPQTTAFLPKVGIPRKCIF